MNAWEHDDNGLTETKHDGDVAVTIDILTLSLLISAVLYSFCLILAKRKFTVLHRLSPEMSTKKLLILSVALVAVVRIMTILGVVSLNIANVRAHYSLQPPRSGRSSAGDRHQLFYDKSMTVLFDLPNCMVVSTYVLLTLVWAECFLDSRLHTEPARQWKKTWIIYFMVFNTALYAVQLALYGGIFLAPPSRTVRTLIYIGITGINFTAVVLVLIFYVYLNFRFSVSVLWKKSITLAISVLANHKKYSHSFSLGLSISIPTISRFPFSRRISHVSLDCNSIHMGRCHIVGLYPQC